jgi:hypothetical protein
MGIEMENVTLIRYKSIDGRLFDDEQKCIDYEFWYEKGIRIISQLRYKPSNVFDFDVGKGYIQQKLEIVSKVKSEFLKLAAVMGKNSELDISLFFDINHLGLYRLYYRVECIDSFGREFGHIFYAVNPSKDKLIEL